MSSKLLKSSAVVSVMTLVSRISGLVRDIVIANLLGGSALADAFFVAFRIPNFLRRIFGEGAFSVAFVPVLSDFRKNRTEEETRGFLDLMAGRLGLIVFLISIVGVIAAPLFVLLLASGFVLKDPERYRLTVDALRLTFPYLFFISLVAMAAGIQNTWRKFAVPAVTPVILNLCLIASALWLTDVLPNPAIALAAGVFIAGAAQLAFQLPFLKRDGLMPRPRLGFGAHKPPGSDGVGRVFRLMVPAIFGTSLAQINALVNTQLASYMTTGSVSWLYFADRLMEFPLAIFGIALATAILPTLSTLFAENDDAQFSRTLDWGMRLSVIVGVPAAAALMVLAEPLIATMFRYGEFDVVDVHHTARALVAFSAGLLPLVMVKILAPGFFARENTRTPVRIAAIAMLVNIVVSVALFYPLAHVGLAVATSVSAVVNAGLLLIVLYREQIYRPGPGWLKLLFQVVVATAAMTAALFWLRGDLFDWSEASLMWRVVSLTFCVAGGAVTYFLGILVLGIRPQDLLEARPRKT